MSVFADLVSQLRYAPRTKLAEDIARAEALAADIEPEQMYPEDWLEYRVTDVRRSFEDPALVPGAAVLLELSSLVEHLCERGKVIVGECGPDAVTLDQLASRWQVSRKTVDRYRRRGLIARRVRLENGKPGLVVTGPAAALFERRQPDLIDRAARYSRIERDVEHRIARRAERYARAGLSLNQAALRLARRFDRSHEAVRQLLRRQDGQRDEPIFAEAGPLTGTRRAAAWRATRRGISTADLAKHFGKTRPALARAINHERAHRLGKLNLDGPAAPSGVRETVLECSAVRDGLVSRGPSTLGALLADARTNRSPIVAEESAQLAAMAHLRTAAVKARASLDHAQPEALVLDRIETDLRHATMLKTTILRTHLIRIGETIDQRMGVPLERLGTDAARETLLGAINAASRGLDTLSPARGSRPAAAIGMAVDRYAVGLAKARAASNRATPMLDMTAPVPDWTAKLDPWQRDLAPDPRIADVLHRIEPKHAALLTARFGLDGAMPRTLTQIAEETGTGRTALVRREPRALREALRAARTMHA